MTGGNNDAPGDFLFNTLVMTPAKKQAALNEMTTLFQNSLGVGGIFMRQSSQRDSGSEKFPSPDSGLFGPKTFQSSPNFKENADPAIDTMPAQRLSFGTKTVPMR